MLRTVRILIAVALIIFGAVFVLYNLPPLTDCTEEKPISTSLHWFPATQIRIEPWRGPHHVYGTFRISERYRFHHLYTARLTIRGLSINYLAGSTEDEDTSYGKAEPGYYFKTVHLSTRTALWFLFTGRFGDLRRACHWWLVIADRK
jgi:hypothetical protein